jgi:isopentenyl phosphate kinase
MHIHPKHKVTTQRILVSHGQSKFGYIFAQQHQATQDGYAVYSDLGFMIVRDDLSGLALEKVLDATIVADGVESFNNFPSPPSNRAA